MLQQGDKIRHPTRGVGVIEKISRNPFGKVCRADVRFSGVLVPGLWIDDLAIFETAQPQMFTPRVVDGPSAA